MGSDARRGLHDHPTVSPTAMLEDALLDLSHRGELVLDPFLGLDQRLAKQTQDRPSVPPAIELDPLYVDVIIRCFEVASGAGPAH